MLSSGSSRVTFSVTIIFAFSALLSALPADADETQKALRVPAAVDLRRKDWIEDGRMRFIAACSRCHGMTGDSGIVRPFRERLGWAASEIHDVITFGRVRGAVAMPAWGGSMPDEEIWKLVAYIKSLSSDFEGQVETGGN